MGMHSDSSLFSLEPVETEVRRRVWWMLCQIDVRVSENCGLEPHVPFIMDTEFPMNINDSDLSSSDGQALRSRNEITEMTSSLCKIEMAKTLLLFRRSVLAKEEREAMVHEQLRRYDDIYLPYFVGESDIHRLYRLGIRLMMTRLWALIHDAADEHLVVDSFQEQLVLCNAEIVQIARQLPSKHRQHGWFFSCKHTQWHALAYLLIQLCKHPQGSTVDRAWDELDATFADWREGASTASARCTERMDEEAPKSIWNSMLQLYKQACEVRKTGHLLRDGSTPINASSVASVEYEIRASMTGDPEDPRETQSDLISDPFLGSVDELHTEMSWGQLDDWVQNFQDGIYQEDWEQQDTNILEALDW